LKLATGFKLRACLHAAWIIECFFSCLCTLEQGPTSWPRTSFLCSIRCSSRDVSPQFSLWLWGRKGLAPNRKQFEILHASVIKQGWWPHTCIQSSEKQAEITALWPLPSYYYTSLVVSAHAVRLSNEDTCRQSIMVVDTTPRG
jgi:hypothetical protein